MSLGRTIIGTGHYKLAEGVYSATREGLYDSSTGESAAISRDASGKVVAISGSMDLAMKVIAMDALQQGKVSVPIK